MGYMSAYVIYIFKLLLIWVNGQPKDAVEGCIGLAWGLFTDSSVIIYLLQPYGLAQFLSL